MVILPSCGAPPAEIHRAVFQSTAEESASLITAPPNATERQGCREALAALDFIKGTPSPHRINVDERKWADFTDQDKAAMLRLALCANSGKREANLGPADSMTAYGYSTRKLLATLTKGRVKFD